MSIAQIILSILLILVILGAIFLIPRLRGFITRNIISMMVFTYFAGFIVYLYGFWYGASENIVASSLRASISALEMFASHSDIIEVSEELKEENTLYMILFSLIHFQAIILTLIFILDIFGKRLVSRFEAMMLCTGTSGKKLYLFDGTDENSISVARSIPQDADVRIVFVKGVIDTDIKHFSLLEAMMSDAKRSISDSECMELGTVLNTSLPLSIAMAQSRGWLYRRIIKMISSYIEAEVFLLAWDSETNSDAAFNISESLPDGLAVKVHAGVNISKPHAAKLSGCRYVIPLRRSELVVKDLIENTPILKEGAGRRTLIIGFGHTAKECIKVLAAAGFDSIDVMSHETSRKSEEFLCFNPKLRKMDGLHFMEHDFNTNEFWAYLHGNIQNLYNVVIFDQDQKQTFAMAVRILDYAKTSGRDLAEFRIYLMEHGRQPGDNAGGLYPFGRRDSIYHYNKM